MEFSAICPSSTSTFFFLFVLLICRVDVGLCEDAPQVMLNDYFDSSYPQGSSIPFRPARRIGSEFLGKRSNLDFIVSPQSEPSEEFHNYPPYHISSGFMGKRAQRMRMGSEFLGKRRLGSEFLGKRAFNLGNEEDAKVLEKRALGSEFLGKRRVPSPYDWSWKRARLGSEFLGRKKRSELAEGSQ